MSPGLNFVQSDEAFTIKVWATEHSFEGELIDHRHTPKLRARFDRDAYDFQCSAGVDAWTSEQGWKPVTRQQIESLRVFDYSYVQARHSGGSLDRTTDIIEAATADLLALRYEAVAFFAPA